jgi:hypothetical protein
MINSSENFPWKCKNCKVEINIDNFIYKKYIKYCKYNNIKYLEGRYICNNCYFVLDSYQDYRFYYKKCDNCLMDENLFELKKILKPKPQICFFNMKYSFFYVKDRLCDGHYLQVDHLRLICTDCHKNKNYFNEISHCCCKKY